MLLTKPKVDTNQLLTCQYHGSGHYESYFIRANHPSQARALWIRYTIFHGKAKSQQPITELWAIFFDKASNQIVSAQKDILWEKSAISKDFLMLDFDGSGLKSATARSGHAYGEIIKEDRSLAWDLAYSEGSDPLLLLPEKLYQTPLPKAKSLVISPNSKLTGELKVNGETINVDQWQGSINHNWGSKHTDAYAWGQVAGFDDEPDAFLECATAKIKIGPVWTPALTLAVLKIGHKTYQFNQLKQSLKNQGSYDEFNWILVCTHENRKLEVEINATQEDFVALRYKNPPGGIKTCLNSKIASCRVRLYEDGKLVKELKTDSRAAFEILTDKPKHNIPFGN